VENRLYNARLQGLETTALETELARLRLLHRVANEIWYEVDFKNWFQIAMTTDVCGQETANILIQSLPYDVVSTVVSKAEAAARAVHQIGGSMEEAIAAAQNAVEPFLPEGLIITAPRAATAEATVAEIAPGANQLVNAVD
ncbi:MAG: hypothetical protein AB1589_44455, partial [Cyanobacteriota bacterium]